MRIRLCAKLVGTLFQVKLVFSSPSIVIQEILLISAARAFITLVSVVEDEFVKSFPYSFSLLLLSVS